MSVFDGVTEYRTGTTVMQRIVDGHRGGLYVYRSLEQCLQRARAIFPADSALLGSERAVLKVRRGLLHGDDDTGPCMRH